MSKDRYNYSQEEYKNLKSWLNSQELKEIEELEENCSDVKGYTYWDIYRKAFKFMIGKYWDVEALEKLHARPIYKLKMHLVNRAGKIRNIKFQK